MLNISNSILGLQKSVETFNKSADRISKMGLDSPKNTDDSSINNIEDKVTLSQNDEIDLTKEFIKMELSDVCYKANAKVIGTSNNMLGTVLDIKA
jgi:hypothetical protein